MHLLIDGTRGVYVPQEFAFLMDRDRITNVEESDWLALEMGPDNNPAYWDTWELVIARAKYTAATGDRYFFWHNCDLWLVPDNWEWAEESETFVPPAGT